MFFWGSYNFAAPQQSEDVARPVLRYPLYVPPSVPLLVQAGELPTAEAASCISSDDAAVQTALRALARAPPLRVVHVACGVKHVLAVLELPQTTTSATTATHTTAHNNNNNNGGGVRHVVYGMGSNHHGQLGAHVATYTTTLANLRLDDDGLVARDDHIVSVACGARHTLICTARGSVYVSGDNSCGQLGLDATALRRALLHQQQRRQHPHHGGSTMSKSSGNSSGSGGGSSSSVAAASSSSSSSGSGVCVMQFTALTQLAHIRGVYACGNASFALDDRGRLYSWGEAQHGHLAHNTRGERVDAQTLKEVTEHVTTPQLVRWFERHRVTLVEVAVGKAHVVCRSEDGEVYTCGEGAFGKLGHGDVRARLEPTRVVFAERRHPERVRSIAAGDDHTLVLKHSSVLGSVVYFFGKLSNGDGQLQPAIVPMPGLSGVCDEAHALRCVVAGRGNLSLCLSNDGRLYVWGKHAYAKLHTGCSAAASRATPHLVEVLERYRVEHVAVGGTCLVASASHLRGADDDDAETAVVAAAEGDVDVAQTRETDTSNDKDEEQPQPQEVTMAATAATAAHAWDVVVPHDLRVNARGDGDDADAYEAAVACFLRQYLGEGLGGAYVADMPHAPPRSRAVRYAFARGGAHSLTRGAKVRVWMTDVYALGTVQQLLLPASAASDAAAASNDDAANDTNKRRDVRVRSDKDDDDEEQATAATALSCGQRVLVQWERDDWHDEELTLYSGDETLDEANDNRWQPFWFERDAEGSYVAK